MATFTALVTRWRSSISSHYLYTALSSHRAVYIFIHGSEQSGEILVVRACVRDNPGNAH